MYLPELSVSHYLLVRGPEKAGLQEKTSRWWATSDADIVSAFGTSGVTGGGGLGIHSCRLSKRPPQTSEVFSSSQVPASLST